MGGAARNPSKKHYVEAGNEPEYFVTHIRTESAGGGNVRVYCYNLKHGDELHLVYTVIVPGLDLVDMGRQCREAGADAHNLKIWEGDESSSH